MTEFRIYNTMINKPQEFHATVGFLKNLAGEFYLARFDMVAPSTIDFDAGQYVIFLTGGSKPRHTLSIASSPKEKNSIDFLQSVAPMGEGSKWFMNLKAGDEVSFLGPLGKFCMQKNTPEGKTFVATGCGVAPLRSMILDYLESGGTAPVTLYWGLRFETDVFWKEEFEALEKKYPNFHFYLTLSKPTDIWQGLKGRVTDHLLSETKQLQNTEYYLCGNRQMIVEVRKLLTDAQVPDAKIFTETFF